MRASLARALPAILALGSVACDAAILGKGEATPSGSGPDATGPNLNSGPTDDDLRTKDPELFEIALGYFPGQSISAGDKRLFRLTRAQLDATTRAVLPQHAAPSALELLPSDPLQTNYEYAANLSFSAANFTPLTAWADQISASVKEQPESVVSCAEQGNTTACLEQAAKGFVTRAFRDVVSTTQLERLAKFYSSSVSEVGFADATADLVNVILTSPGYVFRDEVATDLNARLLPAQLLQHLSYTLADAPPEAVGLTRPVPGSSALGNSDLTQAVDLVLQTPAARAKLQRFFSSWLEVKEPQELDISTEVFPELTPAVAAAMVADTRSFLERQLQVALPSLRDVTEATSAIVSQPSAFLYGMEGQSGSVELDPAERLGIFTQPAVIASHSGPVTTRLVKRGVFFTRKVMCLPLGVPPEDIDTSVPQDAGETERERIENVTKPARCAGCHAFINPFGFMQENFDAIGRYRSQDAGKPIDASISVDFLDEGAFSASSGVEALRGFTRSLRFQQCFTRQLFRFYMGRDEQVGDDPLLRQLFFEFAQNDTQSILGMLRSLAGAASFSARAEAP
ncbi:MAG TPA: DUF1588 domain-containing protein [Polyangiaceae bacterium]|nr:DUF1588 domain-containing protein [Polyangiaceae bacterium]